MATLNVNGAPLYYEDHGPKDAPAIVLSPLLYTDTSVFEPMVRMLSEDYRVICYDHRGSGKTTGVVSPSIESSAKDVASLIEKLNLGPCHFFGNCLGADVGLQLAVSRSDLLRSCVLAGPNYQADAEDVVKRNDAQVDKIKASGMKEGLKDFANMWFGSTFRNTKDPIQVMRREKWLNHLAKMKPEEIDQVRQIFHRKDLSKELGRIRCDVLVLCGDEDSPESLESSRKVAKAIPGAEIKTIHHAGYALVIEQPEEVAEVMKAFVNKVERRFAHKSQRAAREHYLRAGF